MLYFAPVYGGSVNKRDCELNGAPLYDDATCPISAAQVADAFYGSGSLNRIFADACHSACLPSPIADFRRRRFRTWAVSTRDDLAIAPFNDASTHLIVSGVRAGGWPWRCPDVTHLYAARWSRFLDTVPETCPVDSPDRVSSVLGGLVGGHRESACDWPCWCCITWTEGVVSLLCCLFFLD